MSDTMTAKIIRSPSYPSMSLKDAVDAVSKIERLYRASPVDRTQAAKLIGYSSLSGPANKALAALATFGLLERAGKGEARVTSRARAILHADDDQERIANLLDAAREPDLFRELVERFQGISVPPEEGVVTYLNRQGFNPTAVRPAAKAFLETMMYVEELKGTESHGAKPSEGLGLQTPDVTRAFGGAKVGDLVQWESQGALQLPKPLRVRMVSEDGNWIAVEGSQTGIPMSEVLVESKTPPAPMFALQERNEADEGEWMRIRVGQDTNVRLMVKGDMGPKEIGRLIKMLEAQKLVLEDD